ACPGGQDGSAGPREPTAERHVARVDLYVVRGRGHVRDPRPWTDLPCRRRDFRAGALVASAGKVGEVDVPGDGALRLLALPDLVIGGEVHQPVVARRPAG